MDAGQGKNGKKRVFNNLMRVWNVYFAFGRDAECRESSVPTAEGATSQCAENVSSGNTV